MRKTFMQWLRSLANNHDESTVNNNAGNGAPFFYDEMFAANVRIGVDADGALFYEDSVCKGEIVAIREVHVASKLKKVINQSKIYLLVAQNLIIKK